MGIIRTYTLAPEPGARMHETDVHIRRATVADADVLAHHRVAMFRAMGRLDEKDSETLRDASAEYFRRAIASGGYHAWVAVTIDTAATIVCGAGLRIDAILPRPGLRGTNLGPDGMLLNVYTEPAWRGRGLASRLVRAILDFARERGLERVNLHSSDDGRSVYERIGFVPTNEMRYTIAAPPSPER